MIGQFEVMKSDPLISDVHNAIYLIIMKYLYLFLNIIHLYFVFKRHFLNQMIASR